MEIQVSSTLPEINRHAVADSLAVLFCPSTSGKTFGVTIDREDLPRVLAAGVWRVANFGHGHKSKQVCLYAYRSVNRRIVYLHRFILDAPAGLQVDHKHWRQLDNRKSEIRLVTPRLNQINRRFQVRGPLRNIRVQKSGRFQAIRWVGRSRKSLGTFDTVEQAQAAVQNYISQFREQGVTA